MTDRINSFSLCRYAPAELPARFGGGGGGTACEGEPASVDGRSSIVVPPLVAMTLSVPGSFRSTVVVTPLTEVTTCVSTVASPDTFDCTLTRDPLFTFAGNGGMVIVGNHIALTGQKRIDTR